MGSNPFVNPSRDKSDPQSGDFRFQRIRTQDRRLSWRLLFWSEELRDYLINIF
jgi:hypothetical protein